MQDEIAAVSNFRCPSVQPNPVASATTPPFLGRLEKKIQLRAHCPLEMTAVPSNKVWWNTFMADILNAGHLSNAIGKA